MTATPQQIAEEILAGAERMKTDLRSTLDISDETFKSLTALASPPGPMHTYRVTYRIALSYFSRTFLGPDSYHQALRTAEQTFVPEGAEVVHLETIS